MNDFQRGQRIRLTSGEELEIIEKLGEGGQGIVYKVSYNGKNYALKWYKPDKLHNPDRFYNNIQNNINKGAPTSNFLWPLMLTEKTAGSFGYLMELRPPQYKDFSKILLATERFVSIEVMINAALNITHAFRALHQNGFSYQDLNDGNFFVNCQTGDVLICDNDNVAQYGDALGVAGKCRYMSPEVVCGKKLPDIFTDRFSLAVVLYLLLLRNHPLEGKKTQCPCMTEELDRKFFGIEPVFVYDPDDDSNRPVPGVHINEIKLWPAYPEFVRKTFQDAFSKEAMNGNGSVMEKTWQDVFTALRDRVAVCSCGDETFIDVDKPSCKCINCGCEIDRPMVMKVKKHKVVMQPGKKVYACHVLSNNDNFSEVKGEVIAGKQDALLIGLRNTSGMSWTVTIPDGTSNNCEDGKVVRIARGIKIKFCNGNEAEII